MSWRLKNNICSLNRNIYFIVIWIENQKIFEENAYQGVVWYLNCLFNSLFKKTTMIIKASKPRIIVPLWGESIADHAESVSKLLRFHELCTYVIVFHCGLV